MAASTVSSEGRHTSFHALTTTGDPAAYNDAGIMAAYDQESLTEGTFSEVMVKLINGVLSTSYSNFAEATNAMAADKGASNWSGLADIS